jgi:EAL domain-containing protein (putative c-di-GMP-specific phosphodiesterase class I)
LKIAKDFIAPAAEEAQEWAFAGAILALGRRLGLSVVAEGVEDEGQLARLRGMGCELGQGFYFARPAPLEQLIPRTDRRLDADRAAPTAAVHDAPVSAD